jgi:uncharacterized protein (TIGR03083 family)
MPPILCAHLIRRTDSLLLDLLRSLTPEDWQRPTIAGHWQVRDIAAHLLDTALRKLSLARDACFVEQVSLTSPGDVARLIHRLNAEGVTVYRRLSPPVLIALMEQTCAASADFHESLDPFAAAAFPVSWAGEQHSLNWFDTARELTERWHHQQQIRLATQRPGAMTPELYHPVLDCFLRGLPHAMGNEKSDHPVAVEITGDCGGVWRVEPTPQGWQLTAAGFSQTHVTIPQEIAWRLFTKDASAPRDAIRIEGDARLAARALSLTAIVA